MKTLGIIPAGGEGSRWGGYYKEFLPYGEGKWMIDRSVEAMKAGGADKIAVISNNEKLAAHARHLRRHDSLFYLTLREKDTSDMMSGMKEVFPFCEDVNYFSMPDTFFPKHVFYHINMSPLLAKHDLLFGCFGTTKPERFGVIQNGRIYNKSPEVLKYEPVYTAWGVLIWKKKVSDFWMKHTDKPFLTEALQLAMDNFKWSIFGMEYYYDMATWQDYRDLLFKGEE